MPPNQRQAEVAALKAELSKVDDAVSSTKEERVSRSPDQNTHDNVEYCYFKLHRQNHNNY